MSVTINGTTGITTPSLSATAPVGKSSGGTGVSSTPAFSAYNASPQTISTGALRKVTLPTEHFDTGNAFDSTTNYRFQPSVAGYYQINGSAVVSPVSTYFYLSIMKNGIEFKSGAEVGNSYGGSVSGLVYLNGSSDYVELYAFTGTTVNTLAGASYCYFDGHFLGV